MSFQNHSPISWRGCSNDRQSLVLHKRTNVAPVFNKCQKKDLGNYRLDNFTSAPGNHILMEAISRQKKEKFCVEVNSTDFLWGNHSLSWSFPLPHSSSLFSPGLLLGLSAASRVWHNLETWWGCTLPLLFAFFFF